jgi:NADH:ubiquinone oxidoreductase subunit F (NADH-binding)
MNIISKIKEAGLVGRGGACFPTGLKWEAVFYSLEEGAQKAYIVCNAAEGEPGVKKDAYIMDKYPERLVGGIKLAIDFFHAEKAYIYINFDYYKKYNKKLSVLFGDYPIEFFVKPADAGYIGGEESSILNAIEGKKIEPRLKPPFPTKEGLYGCPTLVNNVETFYNVSLVSTGDYKKTRFFTINGDCLWVGVYEFDENYTIEKILKETKNYLEIPFFVQVGGDASGIILNQKQLRRPVSGAGSITVYSIAKHKPEALIRNWLEFFMDQSCGQCTPCREGTYRLVEEINKQEIDWNIVSSLLDNLEDSAFCGLGCAVSIPVKSLLTNVVKNKKIGINEDHKLICECLKK